MATDKQIVTEAASRYGIDPHILWGVYGTETSFGRDVTTSSTGAQGPFQFEPGTAKELGVNVRDFRSSAFGAARLLSQYKGRGVAGMLSAYNAGPGGGIQNDYVNKTLANAKSFGNAPASAVSTHPSLPIGIAPTQRTEQLTATIPTFNRQAYEEKAQHQAGIRNVASLFTGGGPGDALLRETLERAGQAPSASEFGGSRVVNTGTRTVLMPVNSGPQHSLSNAVPQGTKLAGFLPGNQSLEVKRIDQGQDIKTTPGGAILAPGNGRVVSVPSNPGGFGIHYPVVHFDTGPLAGHTVYIGHTRAALSPGQSFKEGQVLSHTGNGTGPFVGNATGLPGWAEIGLWGPGGPGPMGAGRQIAPLLGLK